MCGITGIFANTSEENLREKILKMTASLAHRGPDAEHIWIHSSSKFALGHRRLSILDLRECAAQPMDYIDRYTIVHNGEIYNYRECRDTLIKKGYHFKTESDTEVIAAAFDLYREKCLDHFDGMFSFAIWDEKEQTLFCARDRFGEKPFFFHYNSDHRSLYFASEIKALFQAGITKEPDNELLLLFLADGQTNIISDPSRTFYRNIQQLPASHYLVFKPEEGDPYTASYWDFSKQSQHHVAEKYAIDQFNELLELSVMRRLRSDVPVGSSLSGGLDSSSIAAKIHKTSAHSYKSFSAIFPGFEKDESGYIKNITDQFGIKSYTITPSAEEFIQDLDTLIYHHEFPDLSPSVYSQYKVFEKAKQENVTVLLDGQGADEIFAGYGKYIHWYLQELVSKGKFSQAGGEKKALQKHDIPFKWSMLNFFSSFMPSQTTGLLERKAVRKVLNNKDLNSDFVDAYFRRNDIYKPLVLSLNDILYFDSFQSGLNNLLRYADRNSMAHGREVRLPFLFHELVSFAFSLPSNFKIRNGWTKWLVRQSMRHELPSEIVWRKDKIGFEAPDKEWLNNPLVQAALHDSKKLLVEKNILNKSSIGKKNQPNTNASAEWRYLVSARWVNS
jgi:asparagine synthase (glutamine-hydrolysing)